MRSTRGWLVNLFLWLCPLTALVISLAVWWTKRILHALDRFSNVRYGDAPSSLWFLLPVITIPLALTVAWRTHRLLGFAAAVSLLLASAIAMTWPRSYWIVDLVAYAWRSENGDPPPSVYRECRLVSSHGGLSFEFFEWRTESTDSSSLFAPGLHDLASTPPVTDYFDRLGARNALPSWIDRLGLKLAIETTWIRQQSRAPLTFALPFWFLLLLLTLPAPLAWTLRARRRRRARLHPSACPHCGYDLRATPDPTGPRLPLCPECGAAP